MISKYYLTAYKPQLQIDYLYLFHRNTTIQQISKFIKLSDKYKTLLQFFGVNVMAVK